MLHNIRLAGALVAVLALQTGLRPALAQSPSQTSQTESQPTDLPLAPTPLPSGERGEGARVQPPDAAGLAPAQPEETDTVLPINLATALRLADARPVLIEAARAAVEAEFGLFEQARALWLPTVFLGGGYWRHDGSQQNLLTGQLLPGARSQFLAGSGAVMAFGLTDAIYSPLAERQLLRARQLDVQTQKNDALLSVAGAYFDVQQARGILAGTLDSITRARDLARRVGSLGRGLAAPIEVERANALLFDLEQQAASFRQDWQTSSAELTRVLRLDPGAVVVPLEPSHLRVTLISPKEAVDALIPVGLTSRPELGSQQAIVQATLVRLRAERMRPLIPSLVLSNSAQPFSLLGAGVFGSGTSGLDHWAGRNDWNAQVVWELQNLGFGNRGRIIQRRGEERQALVELFRIQDLVAAEVAQAHAQVKAAAVRVGRAEAELKASLALYEGNLKGLSQTVRAGELLVLISRPQEVVAALQQLQLAYRNYYTSANDYNRAQFRLYRALGYPSQGLACGGSFGPAIPVDTSRPPPLPPVHTPPPCQNCPR